MAATLMVCAELSDAHREQPATLVLLDRLLPNNQGMPSWHNYDDASLFPFLFFPVQIFIPTWLHPQFLGSCDRAPS